MTQKKRNIKLKPRYREQPDIRKLSRALLALAEADAEAKAQAEHKARRAGRAKP